MGYPGPGASTASVIGLQRSNLRILAPLVVFSIFCAALECRAQPEIEGVRMFGDVRGGGRDALTTRSAVVTNSASDEAQTPDPKRLAARINEEAVELVLQGDAGQGESKLQRAHALDPENPTVMYNLAGILLSKGKHREAVAMMEKAVAAEPRDVSFLNRLAEAYTAAGEYNRAVESYEKIVEIDPKINDPLVKLGTLYGITQQWEHAERVLRTAEQRVSGDPQLLNSLGSILIVRGKHREAIDVLKAARLKFRDGKNSLALGIAHESLGDTATALKYYREAQDYGEKGDDLQRHIAELQENAKLEGSDVRSSVGQEKPAQ